MSIEMRNISFQYPGANRSVLVDTGFTAERGECVALMSPSGAGKSTALAIAGLLLKPNSGQVILNGEDLGDGDHQHARRREISWLPQTVNLLPRRTVTDNVALAALVVGRTPDVAQQAALQRLSQLGLERYANQQARKLSGGEAQRVALARALAANPRVLIADEPTANLDNQTAQHIARLLKVASDDTAVVLATHDPTVAEHADSIYRLVDGKFVREK